MLTTHNNANSLSNSHKFALGMGFLAMFFANQTLPNFAIPYYQMILAVDPILLAIALKLPVIIALMLIPFVASSSDKCRSSLGRRRPYIIVFPWLSGLAFGLIWMVPASWTPIEQIIFLAMLGTVFYIFNDCWIIPLKCLAYECSPDSKERTKVFAFATTFIKVGGLFGQWLFPLAQLSIFGSLILGVQYIGWITAVFLIGFLGMLPGLMLKEKAYKNQHKNQSISLKNNIISILKIRKMRLLMGLIITQFVIGGLAASMDYYVLVYYVEQGDVAKGSVWKGLLSTAYAAMGFVAIVALTWASSKWNKINTLKIVYLLAALGGIAKWFIFSPGNEWKIAFDALLSVFVWPAIGVLVSSMIGDIISQDTEKNQIRREGMFVSIQTWSLQISMAVAAILSGVILNLIGFDAQQQSAQSDSTIFAMRMLLVGGTVLSAGVSYYLVCQYEASNDEHNA